MSYKVKKSTPSCSTDPKSVAPMQRVYVNFPTGPFPSRLCIMLQYTIGEKYHSLQHSVQSPHSYYKLFEHNQEVVEHNEVVLLE